MAQRSGIVEMEWSDIESSFQWPQYNSSFMEWSDIESSFQWPQYDDSFMEWSNDEAYQSTPLRQRPAPTSPGLSPIRRPSEDEVSQLADRLQQIRLD